jgi:hypothetical protein
VADVVADGKTRVYWVTTISNQNAPTTAELNADGLNGFQPDTAAVDVSSLASTFTANANGRTSFSSTKLRLKKQASGDTIFTTLVRDTAGFVVIRRSIVQSTAWASSQAIEVYPALIGEVARMDPEPNTVERYELPVQITAGASGTGPSMRAAVA